MPSSITANLNSPYLTIWMAINSIGYANITFSGNVATVGTHPFSTGDVVYVTNFDEPIWKKRFAIYISPTQISVATSYVNAIAQTATSFADNLNYVIIANTPSRIINSLLSISSITEPFLAYSKSAQSFSVTDNVAIDFTVPPTIKPLAFPGWLDLHNTPVPWAFGLIADTGGYKMGLVEAGYFLFGDSVTGLSLNQTYRNDQPSSKASLTLSWRILIQNQRAYIQVKTTTNTYITLFTSSILSTNIQGLRFFSSLALNGLAFTNCTINYL